MGVWEEIVDYTVPSNTTSVTLNNFGTITKDDFIKINISAPTNASGFMKLLANNSSANDYYGQTLFASGSGISSSRQNDNRLNAASGEGNTFIMCKLSENNVFNVFSNQTGTSVGNPFVAFNYNTSTNATFASGITSFTITQSNILGAGSRIQIYRLNAEKVADITVASNTTQVDITGLNIDKGSEYLLVSDVLSTTGLGLNLGSNDVPLTNNNYYWQRIQGEGTTANARRDPSTARIMEINGAANSINYTHIKLSNIGAYTYQAYTIGNQGSSSLRLLNYFGSSTAENITTITKLNLISTASNAIASGTRFQLYKLY